MENLSDAFSEYMPLVDEYLALAEVPLHARPLQAAMLFVEWFVEQVNDGKGSASPRIENHEFVHAEWFTFVHAESRKWYGEQFGERLMRSKRSTAKGVVLIHGLAIELAVPLTISRVGEPGKSLWLCFPGGIEDDENPLDWLIAAPRLDRLERGDFHKTRRAVCEVATALRTFRIGLMGVTCPHEDVTRLLDGVLPLFESAAANLLRSDDSARGDALWTCQMALEKLFKALALQRTGAYRETHDLYLLTDAVATFCKGLKRGNLDNLPKHDEIMEYRYGLIDKPNLAHCFLVYRTALRIAVKIAAGFEHDTRFVGFRALLEQPAFLKLPDDSASAGGDAAHMSS